MGYFATIWNNLRGTKENVQRISFPIGATDSFSRLRISGVNTQLDLKLTLDKNTKFFDELLTGAGTASTYNTNQASVSLSVPANTISSVIRQSKLRGIYQPGESLLILCTAVLGEKKAGITKRVGYFDEKNGVGFIIKNQKLGVFRRSYVTGSAVDTIVYSDAWNYGFTDNTRYSVTRTENLLDTTKTLIFGIDLEWLGVGVVNFFTVLDGQVFPLHSMGHANVLDKVYMSNPNLPLRYEIENDGTGGADTLVQICGTVQNEGDEPKPIVENYISTNGTPRTLANQDLYTPIISIRLKPTHLSVRVIIDFFELLVNSADQVEWRIYRNPTIAGVDGASWVNVDNSAIQYDVSRTTANTVSGGQVIAGGFASSTSQVKSSISSKSGSFESLGSSILGTSEEWVFSCANLNANSGSVFAGISVHEYF